MKHLLHALVFVCIFTTGTQAQLISKFTWENSNVLKAEYGPDATSISSYAVSAAGGYTGNGLSAGSGSHDINMVLPGSYFTKPGLDISIDFRRKESQASFFTLGNFDFGINGGSLYAKFDLVKGTGDTIINATNIYSVPSDEWHRYRFVYDASTGTATVSVDGVTYYTYKRTPSTSLYWTGAGNATVGVLMDGTGSNVAILDNLVISNPAGNHTLPLQLLSFTAKKDGDNVALDWSTSKEFNVRHFIIERSGDGAHFETVGVVGAKEGYSMVNNYHWVDSASVSVNYYRLKMVDIDGQYTYSEVRVAGAAIAAEISCYPNPVIDQVNIRIAGGSARSYNYVVTTIDGKTLQTGAASSGQMSLNLSAAPKGMLVIRLQNAQDHSVETFKLLKK